MKKNDWILAAVILGIAAVFIGIHFFGQKPGSMIEIHADGHLYGVYSLEKDCTVEIGGTNTLRIRDHKADMVWADCPDKLCVHQRAITRSGETIICLPNKIVVTVSEGRDREMDTITN